MPLKIIKEYTTQLNVNQYADIIMIKKSRKRMETAKAESELTQACIAACVRKCAV